MVRTSRCNDVARQAIAIVGAGIIGVAAAAELMRRGHAVTLFDPAPPSEGASFGNAALIAVTQNRPIATPDLRRELYGLLRNASGPLRIRPSYLPRLTPWGIRLLLASRASMAEATSVALSGLLAEAMPAWNELAAHWNASRWFVHRGLLSVYRYPEAFAQGEGDAAIRRRFGARVEVLDADAIRQMEPALRGPFAGALFHPDVAHVSDPGALTRELVTTLVANGLQQHATAVRDIRQDGDGVVLHCDSAQYRFGTVVLAAGIDSGGLARRLGCRVPLESERGYHLELPDAADLLSRPVGFGDRKFVLSPLKGRLRLAGTIEFAGRHAEPDWRRAELLLTLSREILPDLPSTQTRRWSGHRPSTPDSRPILGRAPAADRVIFAFGHGHLGLSLAAVTARRVAALVARETPNDLAAFAPDRGFSL